VDCRNTVVLHKRSETSFGSIFLGDITTDGTLGASSALTRQIEIIGDSITVGYGLDGTSPCTNTAAIENNPLTYGALAAESLGADYNMVAWSGKGIIRNYVTDPPDTSPIISEPYTRYGANDADDSHTFPATWNPNAIVINLGINDFGYVLFNSSGQPTHRRPPRPTPSKTPLHKPKQRHISSTGLHRGQMWAATLIPTPPRTQLRVRFWLVLSLRYRGSDIVMRVRKRAVNTLQCLTRQWVETSIASRAYEATQMNPKLLGKSFSEVDGHRVY
jgi:hypothetical protein